MLKKKNKLSIKGRLKAKTAISSPLFTIKVAENNLSKVRFAILVPKTVDKRAVYRNKMKRRLASELSNIEDNVKKGYDFLVLAKKKALISKGEEIGRELLRELKKQDLLK